MRPIRRMTATTKKIWSSVGLRAFGGDRCCHQSKPKRKLGRSWQRGLGKAELEFATSITAPLYWVIRDGDEQYPFRNGSAFFLDGGKGPVHDNHPSHH